MFQHNISSYERRFWFYERELCWSIKWLLIKTRHFLSLQNTEIQCAPSRFSSIQSVFSHALSACLSKLSCPISFLDQNVVSISCVPHAIHACPSYPSKSAKLHVKLSTSRMFHHNYTTQLRWVWQTVSVQLRTRWAPGP